jgi:predicted phosphodiesterase
MDRKDESLHDERLDDIITWGVELSLRHIENFHVLKRNYDNGIAEINIRGKSYIAVHGDFDKYSKSGVSNLCMHLGFIPYAITYGHLHTCAIDDTNGVKMIRGGSLAGSGDDYTIEKRLSGKPSQMVCVCNKKGVMCYYPIELD